MLHALQHPSALCPVPVYHGSTRRIAAKAREKALIWRASVSCSCTAVATAATAATAMAPGHHEAVEAPKALEVAWLPPNSAWPQAPGHHGSIVKDTTHHYPRVDIEASPSVMDLVETVAASSTCPSNHVSSLFTDTPRVAEVGSWPSRYDMPPVQALGPLGVPTLRLTGTAIIYGSSPSSPPPPPAGGKEAALRLHDLQPCKRPGRLLDCEDRHARQPVYGKEKLPQPKLIFASEAEAAWAGKARRRRKASRPLHPRPQQRKKRAKREGRGRASTTEPHKAVQLKSMSSRSFEKPQRPGAAVPAAAPQASGSWGRDDSSRPPYPHGASDCPPETSWAPSVKERHECREMQGAEPGGWGLLAEVLCLLPP